MTPLGTWRRWWRRYSDAALVNPIGFFYIFRSLTWVMAAAIIYTRSAPAANLRYEPGLLLYAALQLFIGSLYSFILHPRLVKPVGGVVGARTHADLLALGLMDMVGSFVVLWHSGGWESPFWHLTVTALLVPCFLIAPRWGTALVTLFVAAYVLVVATAGEGFAGLMGAGQRNLFFGNIVTAYLVAIAVGYLGTVFRSLHAQRLRTRQALDETEVLFRVTQNIVEAGSDVDHLLSRLTQVIRASGLFQQYAVYLTGDGGKLALAASSVGIEELPAAAAERVAKERRPLLLPPSGGAGAVRVVAPLVVGDELFGVVVAGLSDPALEPERASRLVESMASQIALGIYNARLARSMAALAAQEERSRISREIHDSVAQSIYMLSLQLETCAELASRPGQDLQPRLQSLVSLSKQTLLEVRHYIFDLKPYLAGERSVVSMVESQVREFRNVTGIPTALKTTGEEGAVSTAVATCLYRVTQEGLANAFKHARATQVNVVLEFQPNEVALTVQDDGRGFDPATVERGHGLGNMRRRVEELRGSFAIDSVAGKGTTARLRLPR